jgi:hypothetical protein
VTPSMRCAILIVALAFATFGAADAEDLATYSLTLRNHRFSPTEMRVPSGKPFFIVVTNQDDTADEFEMTNPAIEKVIPPGGPRQSEDAPTRPWPLCLLRRLSPRHRSRRHRFGVEECLRR